ncbi:MAG: glucose-6-phosphate dehydrogenase assembly protein OpcA [Acidimicrobiales bacterium]
MTAVELGSWRGEGVHLGQVLEALSELRRNGQKTATRASVTNLVVVAADDHEVARSCAAVHRLGRRHPGRNIVLLPLAADGPARVDAEVLLHGSGDPGPAVWSEDVRLTIRGAPATRLGSLVQPLTLADVPVVVWFASGLPEPHDPLLDGAATVLVDTADLEGGGVAPMTRLMRRRVVTDLCWIQLRPWRQLLAGLFEVPACQPFLAGVREVHAGGGAGARLLLAGWVSSRLGLVPGTVQLVADETPSLRVVAGHDGATGVFTVELDQSGSGPGLIRARAEVDGAESRQDRLLLPEDPLAWSLGEALAHSGRDRAHVQAVQGALVFSG